MKEETGDKIKKKGKPRRSGLRSWALAGAPVHNGHCARKLSQSYRWCKEEASNPSSLTEVRIRWFPPTLNSSLQLLLLQEMILDSWLNTVCLRKMQRLRCPISYLHKLLKIDYVYLAVCYTWLSNKPDLFKVWEKEKKLQLLVEWFYWKCQHSIMRFILKVKDSGGKKKRILFRNTFHYSLSRLCTFPWSGAVPVFLSFWPQ